MRHEDGIGPVAVYVVAQAPASVFDLNLRIARK